MSQEKQENLFIGEAMPFGGLSNEEELAKVCPQEFQEDNPWSEYVMELFFRGGSIQDWELKSSDQDVQSKQLSCLRGLLETFALPQEDKMAVAGWMLSEMCANVPEHTHSITPAE